MVELSTAWVANRFEKTVRLRNVNRGGLSEMRSNRVETVYEVSLQPFENCLLMVSAQVPAEVSPFTQRAYGPQSGPKPVLHRRFPSMPVLLQISTPEAQGVMSSYPDFLPILWDYCVPCSDLSSLGVPQTYQYRNVTC